MSENISFVKGPAQYLWQDTDNIVSADSSDGEVVIILPHIGNSGLFGHERKRVVKDHSGGADAHPIIIMPSGEDKINGNENCGINKPFGEITLVPTSHTDWEALLEYPISETEPEETEPAQETEATAEEEPAAETTTDEIPPADETIEVEKPLQVDGETTVTVPVDEVVDTPPAEPVVEPPVEEKTTETPAAETEKPAIKEEPKAPEAPTSKKKDHGSVKSSNKSSETKKPEHKGNKKHKK